MDPAYAQHIGVNIDDLLVSQPDNGEQALEIAELLDPQRRARRRRGRLGRGADAARRDRGRDGRQPRRPPGAPHEPGAPQARRDAQQDRHGRALHEPAPREDRRHVRQPGDDARRPRAQVLLVRAARHPPHRDAQGRRRGDRQPRPREGREEQGRAAVQAGRVRHHLRRRHLLGGLRARRRARAEDRPEGRLVLQLRRRAARPGPPERDGLPAGAPGRHRRDRARRPGAARTDGVVVSARLLPLDDEVAATNGSKAAKAAEPKPRPRRRPRQPPRRRADAAR